MSTTHLIPAETLARARELRQDAAPAETKLWWCLRNRRLGGYKFRRQHPVAPFIADFYCSEADLIVELDGDSHAINETYDAARTKRLERDGYRVIRFTNSDVGKYLDAVLLEIFEECERRS
jgi:very-short-patch-repair endonuclease